MPLPILRFHFDLTSPYACLGFHMLERFIAPGGPWSGAVIVDYIPVFLGGIMKVPLPILKFFVLMLQLANNTPPATNPLKGQWLMNDLKTIASMRNVPMKVLPSCGFPMNTLQAMRLLVAVKQQVTNDKFVQCTKALFQEYWFREENISDVDVLRRTLSDVIGETDVNALFAMSQQNEIKQKLVDNTQTAVESGAFGVPWISLSVDGGKRVHHVFGSDRWDNIAFLANLPRSKL